VGRCLSDRSLSEVESADEAALEDGCAGVGSAVLEARAVGEGGDNREVWDTSMSELGVRSFGWRGEPAGQ
jgi:hypothetical protein